MICSNCGKYIKEKSKFCSECGNIIKPNILDIFKSNAENETPNHKMICRGIAANKRSKKGKPKIVTAIAKKREEKLQKKKKQIKYSIIAVSSFTFFLIIGLILGVLSEEKSYKSATNPTDFTVEQEATAALSTKEILPIETPTGLATPPKEITTEPEEVKENKEKVTPSEELKVDGENIFAPFESTMAVHFIDMGQADSTLVICNDEKGDNHALLIDAGDTNDGTKVRNYLKKQNIASLDYMLLTHSDADHIGGAASVVSNLSIDTLWMCSFEKDNKTYNNLINEISYNNYSWSTPKVGDTYLLGAATITIIAPNRTYSDPNNSSIGVIIEHGDNRFMFTGDASEEAETDMVKNGIDLKCNVLKVPHHGSKSASTEAFINAVSPQYGVISCGENNSYGHPNAEVLNRFRDKKVQIFRTDEQGTIIATSKVTEEGTELMWNTSASTSWQAGEGTTSTVEKQKTSSSISSELPSTTNEEQASAQSTPAVEQTPIQPEQQPAAVLTTYVANTNTKKFHYPSCSSVNKMKASNKWEVTTTREDLINQGYNPCKICNP